ncbi:MAG TPA: flagellar basal-body MS-ring/collar protein FliF [Candidatus Binatia bacterium]
MLEQILQAISNVREWLRRFLSSLSPQHKRLIVIGAPVFLAVVLAGTYLFKRNYYSPLFTNLSPQDGAAVIRELEADKIPFQIRGDGSTIAVPRQIVYEARLKLAGKGIPLGGGVGFEIFEKTSFGMSEFTQQINYLRALQGELARTINVLGAVQSSRVHLALPARASFLGSEEKPSASAVIELKPGYHLTPDQVDGIIHLISTSVPKLTPDQVTVLDTSGRLLRALPPAGVASEPESLHQLRVRFEQEMERRIETMLDPVLGPGRVVVRVNAQMSFQETQTMREQFDPNNQVVRAQQQLLDDAPGKSAAKGVPGVQSNVPGGETANQNQTNQNQANPPAANQNQASQNQKEIPAKRTGQMVSYEVGKTTSRTSEPRGQITRTSVAVLVDGKYESGNYLPRTAEELEQIKGIVMKAMGFNVERGDQVEVANIPFKGEPLPSIASAPIATSLPPWTGSPLGIGVVAGVALLAFLLLSALRRGKRRRSVAVGASASAPAHAEALLKETVAVAAERVVIATDPRREQLIQIARDYHEATVRIIRMWLQEDSGQRQHPGAPTYSPPTNGKQAEVA